MRRCIIACGGFLLSLLLSACSGGGGGSLPQGAKTAATPGPQAGTPAASGTIYGVGSNTINLNGGAGCGYVNVTYSSATTIIANGYSLTPGAYATVYGSGNCTTSITASTISLGNGAAATSPSTTVQTHVLTGDYLGGYAGTKTVTASQAAPVLSWAEVAAVDANNISAAGIKTLDYIDPFRQASTDPLYSSDDSTFAHDCSGNRIPIYLQSATQYLMNPGSTNLENAINVWQAAESNTGHIDAFFYDDIDTLYGVSATPCDPPSTSWDSLIASFIATSQHPVVFNGYGMNADSGALIGLPSVRGGMVEGCYGDAGSSTPPYVTGSTWTQNENLELAAAAAQKLFFCYNAPTTDAASSLGLRQFIDSSFLLTYS
ncbi:MAG: hypothetical protein ACRENA_13865, partial [Vulcanimicrobiaceae bacterium]